MPPQHSARAANWLALATIALWASLAALGAALRHVPPFLLTGLGLLAGSLIALPLVRFDLRRLAVPWPTLAVGVYGLFGYHFLLFTALGQAPAVEANLVNYLWPLGIVLMAPLLLPGVHLGAAHVGAALAGFAGAAIAILGRGGADATAPGNAALGFACAAGAAFIWSSYSLLTKRLALTGRNFPTAAIGTFGLVSGLLALATDGGASREQRSSGLRFHIPLCKGATPWQTTSTTPCAKAMPPSAACAAGCCGPRRVTPGAASCSRPCVSSWRPTRLRKSGFCTPRS